MKLLFSLVLLIIGLVYILPHSKGYAQTEVLWEAVKSNNLQKAKIAIQKGADVNAKDELGAPIIMWATFTSNLDMVKLLVSKKADYTKKGVILWGYLECYGNLTGIAAHKKDIAMLRYFIEELHIPATDRGINLPDATETGKHALDWAIVRYKEDKDETTINYLEKKMDFEQIEVAEVNLMDMKLTELPSFVYKLKKIKELNFSRNPIESLPPSLKGFKNLTVLHCFDTKLTNLPEWIGELKNLKRLNCSENQLIELPKTITNLSNLEALFCSSNELKSLPEDIGELKNLEDLVCFANKLTNLPASLGEIEKLKRLRCARNQIDTLLFSFQYLKNLETLDCEENQLTSLPNSLGDAKKLQHLYCSSNLLKYLPETLDKLESLIFLDVSFNDSLKNLPAKLEGLKNLKNLSLWCRPNHSLSETEKQRVKQALPNCQLNF